MNRRSRTRTIGLAAVAFLVVVGFLVRRTGIFPAEGPDRSAFDPAAYREAPMVPATDAASVVGERALVCGSVVNAVYASSTGGQPTFLNFDRPYPNQPFDAVIWGRDRGRFAAPPEATFLGMDICVAGRVSTHDGVPRIEVRSPEQFVEQPGS